MNEHIDYNQSNKHFLNEEECIQFNSIQSVNEFENIFKKPEIKMNEHRNDS